MDYGSMSFDLTDRGIKLLYRQRGSHLRKIDGEIETLIIEDQTPSPTPDVEAEDEITIGPQREPESNVPLQLEPEPEPEPDVPVEAEAGLPPNEFELPEISPEVPPEIPPEEPPEIAEPPSIPDYHFQNIPLRQLSSTITSIASIETIKSILTNLLEKDLIPHAKSHFESDRDRESKMMHKLDVRIFQLVSQNLNSDLQDILDINISNNQLLYQLRQLMSTREDLNQQLVQTRSELQQLKCGGEWYQLKNSQDKLQSRLRLNQELNQLTKTIESKDAPPLPKGHNRKKYDIDDLCDLLNPHTGLLNRLQNK
ncbi:ZYRO0C05104p [Zygosaccharomyces rouxii]|uniref:ZYRO0C05104p n=1 Tax=Zygosaccharomyces rouxii (strain ATCC 2623 / CBS 732 / NBRC 1130 / NCYC 568 / NRRL Y-229) TaxID=559307 RepID=C5DT35_ZYGRC|nr:uncharacterized protein ZYRO0C05104g [Zygosaccharomyces rouxii]KAH9201867.1 hypothetical protein LQ764DRAFT_89156 [Zygosaccharomyces rouxii]CAR26946.1 ZYRO0C05104p [Zygosaccharomyces rouxii]